MPTNGLDPELGDNVNSQHGCRVSRWLGAADIKAKPRAFSMSCFSRYEEDVQVVDRDDSPQVKSKTPPPPVRIT